MRHKVLSVLFLLIFCVAGPSCFGQSGKGSLSGQIQDTGNAMLQGAQVELHPSGARATTDGQGEFNIPNLNPGSYKVTVSYVGFEPSTQTVVIVAGKTMRLEAVVRVAGATQSIVVFSGRQSGEAEAINRTRVAENIVQVLLTGPRIMYRWI